MADYGTDPFEQLKYKSEYQADLRGVVDTTPLQTTFPYPSLDWPNETRVTSETGGQKGSKAARYDLVPAEPLRLLATLYGNGAQKYDERNWELGYEWSLSFAALNRHLWAFWSGEDYDEEMGLPHLTAVVFHAFALAEFMKTHPEFDDRPTTRHDEGPF